MSELLKEVSFRNLIDSLKLTPKHRLVEFGDIWAEIFLWCFMTSIVIHIIASIFAIRSLRNHKIGRCYSIVIILSGIITPIIPSAFTSALISAIFYAASVELKPFFCFLLGIGQTGVILFFSFIKILSTL
ncbi:unnamed protein product [Rotaria sordida]|uniref:Transmembrane protein 170A n=1 Tax=Rotaria sordida TaxID=392033 RepID=A0A819QID0_9BILA|nr:unnamed protein product [Rotaria sordida]CAF1221777.1 unnamed protein product [Rotaria sordida]CAF1441924.1 unnamed protein product [Rotaria sordida]CAF3689225.1 unnamed protein product [Rotaria sordida]CAF3851181.1 unnamed protein product [Rotaria sordida]